MGYLYVNRSGDTNLYKIGEGDDPDARRRIFRPAIRSNSSKSPE